MSVERCLEINARLRVAGVTVHEASGWKTRSNGYVSNYVGGLVHHTATGFANAVAGSSVLDLLIHGRPDLDGPLCNYAGNMDGSLTVVSAGPANHAGASGGRSMGPLPVTKLFNPRVLGLEIVYPGTVAMKPAQMRTAQVWARVVADVVGGGDIDRVRAHAETSVTGKWDPGYAEGRTIDMAAFRRAAKTALQQEDDMELTDRVDWDRINALGPDFLGHKILGTWQQATATRAVATQILSVVTNDPDITPAQIDAAVDKAVAKYTPSAAQNAAAVQPLLVEAMRDVIPDEQATLILRKLAEKLAAGGS
jgi:hypothetical protein